MLKEIKDLRVENLMVAISPRDENDMEDQWWDVILVNLEEEPIKNVMVTSRGYGEIDGEQRATATFRHFFEVIDALDLVQVETIHTGVFGLANEFWVSFSFNGDLLDKKYVFVQGSIAPEFFVEIPFLGRRGVVIR